MSSVQVVKASSQLQKPRGSELDMEMSETLSGLEIRKESFNEDFEEGDDDQLISEEERQH
jgi:hypothetical protein